MLLPFCIPPAIGVSSVERIDVEIINTYVSVEIVKRRTLAESSAIESAFRIAQPILGAWKELVPICCRDLSETY